MTPKTKRHLTVREVAQQKGCTIGHVYSLLWAARLPGEKVGRVWLIPAEAVDSQQEKSHE